MDKRWLLFLGVISVLLGGCDGEISASGSAIDCYRTKAECEKLCSQMCYYVDRCNGNSQQTYACAPNIALYLGIAFGVVVLLVIITCAVCCCCPACLIAKYMNRRRQPGMVIQPGPTTTMQYPQQQTTAYPMSPYGQQPPQYPQQQQPYPQAPYNQPPPAYGMAPPPDADPPKA